MLGKKFHYSIRFCLSSKISTYSPFLQVLATSVSAVNKAGDVIRDIMAGGNLDIVVKEGPADLQMSLDSFYYIYFHIK